MRPRLALALLTLPLALAAAAEARQEKTVTTNNIVVGKVEADKLQVHLALTKGTPLTTFRIDNNTVITVDGDRAKLADVRAGFKGSVTYGKSSKIVKSLELSSADAPPPGEELMLRGTIDVLQKSIVTVNRQDDGKAFPFKLTKDTRILVDGVTMTAGDLKRGMKVDVFYVENTTFAVRVLAYVKDTPPEKK
jgi:hypothetical protein